MSATTHSHPQAYHWAMSQYLQNTDADFLDHHFFLRQEPEEQEDEDEEEEEEEENDDDDDEQGDEGYSE